MINKISTYEYAPLNPREPVDLVYTWVNMKDPLWIKKWNIYNKESPANDRYEDCGELEFSISTVIEFLPWIRNIFIITDGQVPDWYNKEDFPYITIVDHEQLFDEHAAYPTFNSHTIEAYLHKIPNLSECFLYANDDCFVGKQLSKWRYFTDNLPVVDFRPLADRKKPAGWTNNHPNRVAIINAQKCMLRKFKVDINCRMTHNITMLRKSSCELTWKLFRKELIESVRHRNRSGADRPNAEGQINFWLLSQYVGCVAGQMIGREWRASPINYRNSHNPKNFKRTSKVLLKSPRHLFCINSAAEMKPAFKEFVESFKQKHLNPWVLAKLIKNLKAFSFLDKEVFKVSQIGRDDPKRIIYYNDKYFITEKKHWDFSFDNNGISVERQDVIKNNTILKILKEGNIKHLPKVYDYDDGWVVFEYIDGRLLRRHQKPYKEDTLIDLESISKDLKRRWCGQVKEGIQQLHDLGICHTDIRLFNILIENNTQDVKIIDLLSCVPATKEYIDYDWQNYNLYIKSILDPDESQDEDLT